MTEEKRTTPLGVEGLDALAEADEAKKQTKVMRDAEEVLSIKERLLKRAQRKTYILRIEDEDGDIDIEIRPLTSTERETALINFNKVGNMKEESDLLEYNVAMKQLNTILDDAVITPELVGAFSKGEPWLSDDVTLWLILQAVQVSFADLGEKLNSFRADTDSPNTA